MSEEPAATAAPEGRGERYGVEIVRDVRVPSAHPRTTLSVDLFLPVGAGAVPALVTLLPYRKDATWGILDSALYRWYAERGYACLMVDLRGIGSSDGPQRPPFDPAEADDALAVIRWAAAQPWCNGRIGMWGHSYGALTTLRTAGRRPEHLRAILPIMGMLDPELDFVHPGGARGNIESLATWGVMTLLFQLLPPLHDYGDRRARQRWSDRLRGADPWILDLLRHGPGDASWRSRVLDVSSVDVPTFCVAGWRDLFCDGSIRAYEQVTAPKKLLVGPWMHVMPQVAEHEPVDFPGISLRWWDHWLRDVDDGFMTEPAVTAYLQGEEPGWQQVAAWPPSSTSWRMSGGEEATLWPEGQPARGAGTKAPERVIAAGGFDPTAGALSTGMAGLAEGGSALPVDQHDDDVRSLTWTSEVLAEAVVVAGRAHVTVRSERTGTPGRLVVQLTDVEPDGRSRLIAAGTVESPGAEAPVELCPTYYRVAPGHRLRLVVTNADFPRLWPAADATWPEAALALRGLVVKLPTLSACEAVPVKLPPPRGDAEPAVVRSDATYATTRDHVRGGISVSRGGEMFAVTPEHGHLLEFRSNATAAVTRHAPAAARTTAVQTATARMVTGETVEAQAELHLSTDTATVRASLTVDGWQTFSHDWEVPLPPAHPALGS